MLRFKSFFEQASTDELDFDYVEIDSMMHFVEHVIFPQMLLSEALSRKVQPRTLQPWDKEKAKNAEEVEAMHKKYLSTIEDAEKEFEKRMKSSTRGVANPKILVDVKSLKSMINKIVQRGKKPGKITDWLRGAILVKDEEDVKKVSENIFKAFNRVEEYEEKERGGDKQYGYYGSKHFLVDVKGITTEIQVMTKKLWAYKGKAHRIYDKYRAAKDVDASELNKAMRRSKQVFDRGNKRGNPNVSVSGGADKDLVKDQERDLYKRWWHSNLKKVRK